MEMQPERPCRDSTRSYNLPPAVGAGTTEFGLTSLALKWLRFEQEINDATGIIEQVRLRV